MNHAPATLAAAVSSDNLNAALVLMVVGMGVVFAALFIMSLGLTLLGRFASANAAKPPATPATDPAGPVHSDDQAPASPAAQVDDHAGQHAVVIAAAVAAVLTRPHRIARVVLLEDNPQRDWVAGGRASVMTSHTPRR